MLSNKIAVCLLVCAAAAFAQAPIPSAQAPIPSAQAPIPPASVSGVVTNAMTGAPIPRVHVIFGSDAEEDRIYGAMTSADGKFSITGMTPGSYAITMERVGFSMPTDPDAQGNLELKPDESKDDLKLTLIPAGAISGRVTNAEGDPVQFVSVSAESAAGVFGDVTATTDADGRFRIGGLAPGRYRVLATPENSYTPLESRTDGTVDVQDAPTYRKGARVVVTAGGETGGIDIRLARVPIVEVSGKVENVPFGSFNAQLRIAGEGGGGRSTAGIKPDGTFRLWRLYPGKYEVSAMWQVSGGRELQSAPAAFKVAGANIDNLRMRVIPPADLAGHIEFTEDSAKPAPGAAPRLILVNTGLRGGAATADVADDGSFHLRQVRAGRYRIGLSWSNGYVASMQLGATAIEGPVLDLTTGATGDLSVRVSSATGAVSGTVTDHAGKGSSVVLAPDGAIGGEGIALFSRFAVVEPGGKYFFRNVAPGKYRLAALPEGGQLDDYEDSLESIEVHPGEKLSRDLKMQSPDGK